MFFSRHTLKMLFPNPEAPELENDKQETEVTVRYDTRCYFNVRWKADMSQLNLPHGGCILHPELAYICET